MAPLCEGPCWHDISSVTAVIQLWAHFDPSLAVEPVFAALQLTCVTPHVVGKLDVSITESTAIKNTLTVSLSSTIALQHDTTITLQGYNAKMSGDSVLVLGGQSGVEVVTLVSWLPPKCSQHCPSSGLCPPEGCGQMCGADGRTPGHGCLKWCFYGEWESKEDFDAYLSSEGRTSASWKELCKLFAGAPKITSMKSMTGKPAVLAANQQLSKGVGFTDFVEVPLVAGSTAKLVDYMLHDPNGLKYTW